MTPPVLVRSGVVLRRRGCVWGRIRQPWVVCHREAPTWRAKPSMSVWLAAQRDANQPTMICKSRAGDLDLVGVLGCLGG